ncbi:hypothetical protein INS49_005742 [Diaporthe citri]|uniref:uncharacterized protein n=1 Tax=Diaporthe citri TaxID=83186 RepID=UPI001C7E76A5|nr:uncharacterized protein INS49_005742 [Diaporthe citri]KAG6364144.1 hypothetical protein INS49_005742 [Diaporthe citri]
MKYSSIILAVAELMTLARAAAATSARSAAAKQCVQLQVPVPVIANNSHYEMPRVDSSIDAIGWELNVTAWSAPSFLDRNTGPVSVDQTFNISAQLCVPSAEGGPKAGFLQIATQGLGWDKRYWDVDVNPRENSYLDAAITQGYSLLTYDRLGAGQSDVPDDAYDVVQIPTEVEILTVLTQLARSGQLLSSSTIVATNAATNTTADSFTAANPPSKIIHIGHSLGSSITSGLLARHGDLSDGSVLTGYYLNSHLGLVNVSFFDHGFAAESAPARFSHYPSGYLLSTGPENMQKLFLRAGAFAPEMLDYVDEVKQPEAVGTYASESVVFGPAMDFKGPLQFITGEYDFPTCGGDCNGVGSPELIEVLFPGAVNPSFYLQPNTGHALTLHYNASAGFHVIFDYLTANGL